MIIEDLLLTEAYNYEEPTEREKDWIKTASDKKKYQEWQEKNKIKIPEFMKRQKKAKRKIVIETNIDR